MLFFCQDTLYRLCKQYDLLVMKATQYKFLILWSRHNVIKEPICTLTRQSLALDQLKYLQIAVNYMYIFCSLLFLRYIKNCATAGFWADSIKTNLHGKQCLIELAEKIPGIIFWHFHIQTLMTLDHCAGFCLPWQLTITGLVRALRSVYCFASAQLGHEFMPVVRIQWTPFKNWKRWAMSQYILYCEGGKSATENAGCQ